jgi:Pup amidohydrolase
MKPILAGLDTEYGLYVEGRGAEDQIEDATALVRAFPGECFVGWDYRYESPRADLRGFSLDRLTSDPEDAKYDVGRRHGPEREVRADRVLLNGARFYNDHGHPEYATPETWSLDELVLHEQAGDRLALASAKAFEAEIGARVKLYKNNTDYHGASFGAHESYLVPRALGFQRLYEAVMPMLVVRQILTGAGKVGSENGRPKCAYQLSQRADFFVEPYNAETLYRRPIFNTRDEPHADPREWIRLHVISGDGTMIPSATRRRVGLVKLALALAKAGEAPVWSIQRPVEAFSTISRDESLEFKIQLEGRNWTTARNILESYFAAAEHVFGLKPTNEGVEGEMFSLIKECRELLEDLGECQERFRSKVDWAAKRYMLEQYMESEGTDWRDPALRAFDLEYHNLDPEEGLFFALGDMGEVESGADSWAVEQRLGAAPEGTRAFARGLAVRKFKQYLKNACWATLTFEVEGKLEEVPLDPTRRYGIDLQEADGVQLFIGMLRGEW